MTDQINNNPALQDVLKSLELVFKDSILETKFEKNELSVKINKQDLREVLKFLKEEKSFNALNDMICLDNFSHLTEGQKRFSILYQLYKFPGVERIRIVIETNEGEVDSINAIFKSSDWAEREIFDMFGINFTGHSNLVRVYLPDDFKGFPLRKDFPLEGEQ
jgi:NADH-quinone oxidoreductase subunit C